MRFGADLIFTKEKFSALLGINHATKQNKVPASQRKIDAYTLMNISITYTHNIRDTKHIWYASIDNVNDTLAYSANSILTQTAFGKAPLPGRTFKMGVKIEF